MRNENNDFTHENSAGKIPLQRFVIFLICFLFLAGCGVEPLDIDTANEKCKTNGGWSFVRQANLNDITLIRCENGAKFEVKK